MSRLTDRLAELDLAVREAGLDREVLLQRAAFRLEGTYIAPRSPRLVGRLEPPAHPRLTAPFARRTIVTLALGEVADILRVEDEYVDSLIVAGELQAVSIHGHWHVPEWQMNADSTTGLLPGLARILEAARGRLDWIQLAVLMVTPQPELVASSPLSIVEWLHWRRPIGPALSVVRAESA